MKKFTFLTSLIFVSLGMAMTMPSCPGQQAMQQQLDTVQKQADSLNNRLRPIESDMPKIRQILDIWSQRIKALEEKVALQEADLAQLKAAAAAKPATKKRGR